MVDPLLLIQSLVVICVERSAIDATNATDAAVTAAATTAEAAAAAAAAATAAATVAAATAAHFCLILFF